MAKRQLLLSSPEKKRMKDPDDEKLRNMVADELKLQLGMVREIFREEIHPMAERIGSLEKEIRAISNNFDNIQSAVETYLARQQALATPTSARNNTPAEALMEASP
ncbi:hypothetical protein Q7C36_020739 [Tachysurus vachellii]|uniref:Uncharacterized protein n=1 Tax=Tachysurus vachellii TaxID=175792 RepID=A0AA88LR76_TACVA|nr:hypothetical protein Q7C36_020739 [Tachysurus vachellii]